jgi:pimeloyl-ACP methyl ester carboxylesterase
MIVSARGSRRSSVADRPPEQRAAGIAFERLGEGPPLVLIHGLGATREIWRPQLRRLADERDEIALDLPGFGASPILAEAPTPWALGAAITRMCAAIGVDRPHLAGNSLGGWVALEIAKAQAAASLCLISPAGLWRRPLGPRNLDSRTWGRRLRPLIMALARVRPAREAMLRTSVGRPDRVPPADGRAMIAAWIDAPGYDAANAEMRRHVATDLDRISVPTTIVWGALDRLVGPPRPERRPPDSRFLQFQDLGHTPNWDDPDLIADLLLEASSRPVASTAPAE